MSQIYDTLLWEYIKNPWRRWLGLDKLSSDHFDYQMMSYDEVTDKKKINFRDVELQVAAKYSWEDVYITYKLFEKQKESWVVLNSILENIEIPLLEVLKDIELVWVKIDRDKLKGIGILLEKEISVLEKEIYHIAWEEFNISSPKQVWEILFEKMALPKWKKTKTGYSVSAEVLWDLAREYEIAQMIVDYRHYNKILSTYINWLLDIALENDFIHASFNQSVTSTWRLSSSNPNLQNIPSSDWLAWEVREAFISRWDNWSIMAFDYSQVEVRILAIMSQDKNLLWAFNSWVDIHHKTAEFIFWKSNISWSERKIAKAVNFWVIYWISSFWLSKMIDISIKDAKLYIDRFFENYPKVKEFLDSTIKNAEEKWYVETLFWRKRYIPWINDKNRIIKSSAEREAINMPIQWTSADIIKIAMIKASKFIKENNLESKMIMQVHDELVFDVPEWEKKLLESEIVNIMENILKDSELELLESIELKVDIWEGKNWRDAK